MGQYATQLVKCFLNPVKKETLLHDSLVILKLLVGNLKEMCPHYYIASDFEYSEYFELNKTVNLRNQHSTKF